MNKILSLITSAILTTGLIWAASAVAHQGGMSNDSYVGDKRHHLVVPGSGGCLRTGSWSEGQSMGGCNTRVVLEANALFDFDRAVIKPAGRSQLRALAASLKSSNVDHVSITGHTDSMGSDEYNKGLSARRANAVKSYLAKQGIRMDIMSTSGMGESRPAASNDTAEGRAMNRRVEVTYW